MGFWVLRLLVLGLTTWVFRLSGLLVVFKFGAVGFGAVGFSGHRALMGFGEVGFRAQGFQFQLPG